MKRFTRTVEVLAGQWQPGDHNISADLGLVVTPDPLDALPRQTAILRGGQGNQVVYPGNWVVREEGSAKVVTDDVFRRDYAALDPDPEIKPDQK